ncbi:tripartite tricarboxylate transporter TctB family protein [Ciceribacter azotifigens]|uniref:tripartite tricarboxylate transporter TctB family protein n=1 Tax=Ciceribacter azotifigens TaxID=2069303 RepID=UPI003A8A6EF9
MSDHSRTSLLTGRIGAICVLAFAVVYGIGASRIDYSFSSDPLGPRVVPLMLAGILGVLALFYLRSPGSAEGFPSGALLVRVLAVPVILIACVAIFEPAGFAASIFLLTFGTGMIFGAPPLKALIGAAGHAALWWGIFAWLLEVYLPVGALFG